MSKLFTKEVKIGFSVLVTIAILIFGINYLKGINIFKASNYYYATYQNVNGLTVSAPVMLNGFKVGQVREMDYDYDHPGNVVVEISVDKDLRIPEGSKALVETDILGTSSLVLELSTSANVLPIGSHLEGAVKPGMMDAVSNQLMPSVSTIFPKIDTLLTSINTLVADPSLRASVQRLDAITADLQRTTQNLARMSAQLAPLTAKFSPILSDVKNITGNVDSISTDLGKLSGRLAEMQVDSLVGNLQATVCNLQELTTQLNDPNSSVGKLMNSPEIYDNINSTITSLDSLFVDIKKNPKRYINVKVF